MKKPTTEDIQRYRLEKNCGVFEAHSRLMKEYVLAELNDIKGSVEPAGTKVTRLIDLTLYALTEEGPRG